MNIASLEPGQPKQCGFCGNVQSQVKVLVAGASTYICDACIERSVEILSTAASPETEGGMVEVLLNPGIEFEIASHRLKKLIDRTEFAMGVQDHLPFNGLLMEIEGDRLRAVATNGHHLAMAETASNSPLTTAQHMILARDSVRKLSRILGTVDGDLAISIRDNRFHVERADLVYSVELLLGRYPNYRAVVPEHSDSIVVDRRDLLSLTKRHQGASSRLLYCAVSEGSLAISWEPEGDELEHVEICYHGKDVNGRFTPEYLNGPLEAIDSAFVKLSFRADHPAWRIESPDDNSAVYVVTSVKPD